MTYVKPGEHPVVDMFEYGKHPFPYDIEMMLRKIDEIDHDLLDKFEDSFIPWAKGEKLEEGRKQLKALLIEKGVDEKSILELVKPPPLDSTTVFIDYIARIIALVWAAWWVIFTIRTYIQADTNIEFDLSMPLLALIFVVSALIPWKWKALGGILLILEGLFITAAYMEQTPSEQWLSQAAYLVIIGIPAVIAGLLFLIHWFRTRRIVFSQTKTDISRGS